MNRMNRMNREPGTIRREGANRMQGSLKHGVQHSAQLGATHKVLRGVARMASIGLLVVLGACAGPPTRSSATGSVPQPTLAQERERLAGLFDGTPVVLEIDRDGSLRAEVPLRFCFEPARAVVKPPLAALLDRLAGSPATRGGVWSVAAPGDPASKGTTLANERAASVRDYLVGHGADALRVSVSVAPAVGTPSAVVRVIVTVPSGKTAPR